MINKVGAYFIWWTGIDFEHCHQSKSNLFYVLNVGQYKIRLASMSCGLWRGSQVENRRARGDTIETFKLLHDKYYDEYSQLVTSKLYASHISREGMRGHRFKLCQEGSKLNLRRESFPVRITKVWNELPDSVVNAPKVNTFKNRLDRHWSGGKNTTTKHPYQDTTWLRTFWTGWSDHCGQRLRPWSEGS